MKLMVYFPKPLGILSYPHSNTLLYYKDSMENDGLLYVNNCQDIRCTLLSEAKNIPAFMELISYSQSIQLLEQYLNEATE